MKVYDLHGNVLMETFSLERRGDQLVVKGKGLGMPLTMYVRPEEIWQGRKLLSWSVISYLPIMVFKGWKQSRKRSA